VLRGDARSWLGPDLLVTLFGAAAIAVWSAVHRRAIILPISRARLVHGSARKDHADPKSLIGAVAT
jgi:hypothetical protein